MAKLPIRVLEILHETSSKNRQTSEDGYMEMRNLWQNDQPENFSHVTIDVIAGCEATEESWNIIYKDAVEMKKEVLEWIDTFLTEELLDMYREEKIDGIRFVIGAKTLSGDDKNQHVERNIKYLDFDTIPF